MNRENLNAQLSKIDRDFKNYLIRWCFIMGGLIFLVYAIFAYPSGVQHPGAVSIALLIMSSACFVAYGVHKMIRK